MDTDVELARRLVANGYGSDEVARMTRRGELVRIRHGAYARAAAPDTARAHRQLIAATVPRLAADACLSHLSAAVLHDLPAWDSMLDRVHAIRDRAGGGRRARWLHLHVAELGPEDVVEIDGLRVTSLARTAADCSRLLPCANGVALGDAALRKGLDRGELLAVLRRPIRSHGNPRARQVAEFIDGRAESVGESFSRVSLARVGLPTPELQHPVTDPLTGRTVFGDFGWPERRTIGEFDGKIKYGRLLRDGEDPGDAVFREKLREDRLRELGWEVVRWCWSDLDHPLELARRLHRAFARAASRAA